MTPPLPTPPHVHAALQTIGKHLVDRGYAGAIVSPQGGCIFEIAPTTHTKFGQLLDECLRMGDEQARLRGRIRALVKFIRTYSAFVGWSKPADFDADLQKILKPKRAKRRK